MRFNNLILIFIMFFLLAACKKLDDETKTYVENETVRILVLDDFDDAERYNNLGGDSGTWVGNPNDSTQSCVKSFDHVAKLNKLGWSLKLSYDVDSIKPANNGFWSRLNNQDLSKYSQLVFYVKGDRHSGYTNKFKIELKNSRNEVGQYLITGITDYWQRITIPFNKILGITNWDRMSEFVIVFDDMLVTKKVGVIYIDDIYFQ